MRKRGVPKCEHASTRVAQSGARGARPERAGGGWVHAHHDASRGTRHVVSCMSCQKVRCRNGWHGISRVNWARAKHPLVALYTMLIHRAHVTTMSRCAVALAAVQVIGARATWANKPTPVGHTMSVLIKGWNRCLVIVSRLILMALS